MPIVTIRGLMGSGAPAIGKLIAQRLSIDYVDREIIANVAKLLKYSEKGIADKEMPPGTLLGRIAEALSHSSPVTTGNPDVPVYPVAYLPSWEMPLYDAEYLAGIESVIKELAHSQRVVVRGRGTQFILKDYPGAFHVFVVAPLDLRIKRVMESEKIDMASARKEIERFDSSRHEFIKRYFKAELENPIHYDLVINTERLNFEDAAAIVIYALSKNRQT